MRRRTFIATTAAGGAAATLAGRVQSRAEQPSRAQQRSSPSGNLLRNGSFQDDWLSLIPQNQTLHWAYGNTFYNRRDFNPDGWTCTGSWRWLEAERPRGKRRPLLGGPSAQVTQRLHWFAVHDEGNISGFPDAGGFPELRPLHSRVPERLVRDLTLSLRLRGEDVPAGAGGVELGLCQLGAAATGDPLGALVKPLVSRTVPLPGGTFDWQRLEIRLPASEWLKAAVKLGGASGLLLPPVVSVALRYEGRAGHVELGSAELSEPGPAGPNLLANGGFESVGADGYPAGWDRPAKYRFFPPKHYYLFTTWHNALFDNRGRVEADGLVTRSGGRSLKMIVPSGDEVSVASHPVRLDQREARLIEVAACVKTDSLCMLGIDAVDQDGVRLDGFSFIHKAPVSIGTDGWRLLRQVFRPTRPLASLRLMLCARGANGYTLDGTGLQPQNNVVGTVWWDDVRVWEPESTPPELTKRGVKSASDDRTQAVPHLADLDLGERLFGVNELTARAVNPGPAAAFLLRWEFTAPSGKRTELTSGPLRIPAGGEQELRVPYTLEEPCRAAYTEYKGRLTLLRNGQAVTSTELWLSTWAASIDLKLGALYLRPQEKQLVRMNLGFSAATLATVASIRLEIVRRGSGRVLHAIDVPATAEALAAQRSRIPAGVRGDLTNLLLTDLDVSALPVQPFSDPQRNWLVRATALDRAGRPVALVESEPFCRQAPEPAQPPIGRVTIGRDNLLRINGEPWMPWGGIYGFAPAYPGPADPGKQAGPGKSAYLDLQNLPGWSMYDRFTGELYTRRDNDLNCARDVAGKITPREVIDKRWTADNLYSSTAFVVPDPVFSTAELVAKAGGQAALDAYLEFCKRAPMVVATTPGLEESFALFHTATREQLAGLRAVVEHIHRATDKPVMVGHGGYWNRLEFEKVPYFHIYDPETEPLYPANLHTDLWPLVAGQEKVIWLRPQMYEDVPYERWRLHAYTELMRGCRGWQIAHGPGDVSLVRGLHGELEFMKPIVASPDPGAPVRIEPWIEHWSRRHNGKTYIIAATTHGIGFGQWRAGGDSGPPAGRARVTETPAERRDEANAYGLGGVLSGSYAAHGIQYLPGARSWPAGSRLVQWVRLDGEAARDGFAVLVKADARFTHAASWGSFGLLTLRINPLNAVWFLRTFYRHAVGFLGWDLKGLTAALQYVPGRAIDMGRAPAASQWARIELPLDKIGTADKLIDGVGFMHARGRIEWGRTSIAGPGGGELEVWGDDIQVAPDRLAQVKIAVDGLRAGTRVRVLFEDRELTAANGYFVDDFRGRDLYQRFGGGPTLGYGDAPVALHVYEVG